MLKRRSNWVGLALFVGMAGGVGLDVVPWPCPVRVVLGVPCPTCGMSRAARLFAHGEVGAALHMHPLVWLVVPFVVALVGIELAQVARGGAWGAAERALRTRAGRAVGWTVAAAVVAVWIARFCGALGGPVPV